MRLCGITVCAWIMLVSLPSCTTLEGEGGLLGGGGGLASLNMVSTEQEKQMGTEIAAQVEQQERVLADPGMQAYINQIGQRLAAVVERKDVNYQFKVIDNPETVNAFALPGGYMYIYTGLLKLVDNEAELASVMGHELAHVSSKHHGEALTRQYGMQIVSTLVLGDNPAPAAQIARDFAAGGGMNYFSRENEREADRKGMDYLVRAGYQPDAMVAFMQKMLAADQAAGQAKQFAFFSTHPATQARIATLSQQAQQYPADLRQQNQLNAEAYQEQVLKKLR